MPQTKCAHDQPISFAAVETAFCACCEAQIPATHIARNLVAVPRSAIAPPTRQIVLAWCEHCDRLYEARRELSMDGWRLISDIEVVTDPKRIASFKARIALLKGDIQARPTPPAKEGK